MIKLHWDSKNLGHQKFSHQMRPKFLTNAALHPCYLHKPYWWSIDYWKIMHCGTEKGKNWPMSWHLFTFSSPTMHHFPIISGSTIRLIFICRSASNIVIVTERRLQTYRFQSFWCSLNRGPQHFFLQPPSCGYSHLAWHVPCHNASNYMQDTT